MLFNERLMENSIKQFRRDIEQWRLAKTLKTVANGIRRLLLFLWWFIGRVDSFFIMSGYFVSLGIVNLILVYSDVPATALDMLTSAHTAQISISVSMIFLGWYVGYSKSTALLTVSALFAATYGFLAAYGVGIGSIDVRGLIVFVSNSFLPLALLRASWSEFQRTKYELALATLKAAKSTDGRIN